jgi:internalin A
LAAMPAESEQTIRYLLRLMERFEMCFPLDDEGATKLTSQWLVPGAMTKFQPAGIGEQWQLPERVRLRFKV